MFERYTEKARRTIFFARYEAAQFGSPFIETEHLLLGVLREDRDASRFFSGWSVTGAPQVEVPLEVAEIEKRIKYIVHRMEEAIANQAFEKARFYSNEERMERENLRQSREKHKLSDAPSREGDAVEGIRRQIEAQTARREKVSTSMDLPLSHESKRVLSYAAEECERLNHRHIGTEHLLLGLLREEKCFAAEILNGRGLHLAQVREEIAKSTPAEAGPDRGRSGTVGFGTANIRARMMGQMGWASALQDAGRVALLARHSAVERRSPCIETTDVLLSLLQEKEFNDRFPGHADFIRERAKAVTPAKCESVSAGEIPFSDDVKLAFTFAGEEAAQLGQRTGPAHLLLGLLRVEYCAAARILRDCGLNAAEVRARLTPPPPPSDPEEGRSYV